MKRSQLTAAALGLLATLPTFAAEDDFPHDALQGIEAMQRLPAEGFHVVQSQGRLLLVSSNGHYVVSGGRLFDMWNQMELHSVADVRTSTRVPLARMGIKLNELGAVSVGKEAPTAAVTVFLDPLSAESRQLLPQLRQVIAQHRVDVVFIPAQPSRAAMSRTLICDKQAALAFLEQGRVPNALPEKEKCGAAELQHARVTAQIIGIRKLPFSVAANGETLSGTPEKYGEFVARNQSADSSERNNQ
jgi:thiol:disulfide interchange protein DsbC